MLTLPLPIVFLLLTVNYGSYPMAVNIGTYGTMEDSQVALHQAEITDRGHNKCVRYNPEAKRLHWPKQRDEAAGLWVLTMLSSDGKPNGMQMTGIPTEKGCRSIGEAALNVSARDYRCEKK